MSDQDIYFDDEGDADACGAGGEGAASNIGAEGAFPPAVTDENDPLYRYQSARDLIGFDDDQAIQLLYALYNDGDVEDALRSKSLRRAAVTVASHADADQIIETLEHVLAAQEAGIITDVQCSKTVRKMADSLRGRDEPLTRFLEHATERVNRHTQISVYIDLRLQQCDLMLKFADYDHAREYLRETDQFCPIPPPLTDPEMCRAAIRLLIVKIELADVERDEDETLAHYAKAMLIPRSTLTPRQEAVLTHIEGIKAFRDGDYGLARTKFYEAFKVFNEMGLDKRIRCLPFCALAAMLVHEQVSIFLAPEVVNFVQHPLVAPLAQLTDAYQDLDIVLFNRRLGSAIKSFWANQDFYAGLLGQVRLFVVAGAIQKFCRKYKRVETGFVAAQLETPIDEVRQIVLNMILDGKLRALIEPRTDLIYMQPQRTPSRYLANVDSQLAGIERLISFVNNSTRIRSKLS
jgi:COP9 signalosome complex subunit 2